MSMGTILGDITTVGADAIVNAANEGLRRGGGVCGAIFAAAGSKDLQEACDKIGHCPTGEAVITPGFALPSDYIIHTVGPVWCGGHKGEAESLASCYQKSLELANDKGLKSVAFPSISTGIFGYPVGEAARVAVSAVAECLKEMEIDVVWVLFDEETKRAYDHALEGV